jgi:hypothetical protein
MGTAVNAGVVFGSLGDDCATAWRSRATRRPAAELYGEF